MMIPGMRIGERGMNALALKAWVDRGRGLAPSREGRRRLVKGAMAAAGALLAGGYARSASASAARAADGERNALVCITNCDFGPNEFSIDYKVVTDVGVQLADNISLRDLSLSAEQINDRIVDDARRRLAEVGVTVGPDDNIRLLGGVV